MSAAGSAGGSAGDKELPIAGSTSKVDLIAAYRECWASMSSLGATLSVHDWASPSLCPGWSCRDVLIHLVSAEEAFFGWTPSPEPPWDALARAAAALAPLSGPAVLAAFEDVTQRRGRQFESMTEDDFDVVGWSPAGLAPHRRYLEIRVFDHWAHEQDIRVPLGRPGHLDGLGPRMSLDEAHIAFGYLVGKRAAAPDATSVTVSVTGPTARQMHAQVNGRAQVVAELSEPTASVTVDLLTFMLLCGGRIDPDGPIADGRVTLSGDLELAERVARNLAFTV